MVSFETGSLDVLLHATANGIDCNVFWLVMDADVDIICGLLTCKVASYLERIERKIFIIYWVVIFISVKLLLFNNNV